MAQLTTAMQVFIVERLACFDKPTDVVEAVKEEFGVTIARQQVELYDPAKRCKTAKWIALHADVRKAFTEQRTGQAITHRSWRQRELEDMARKAKRSKNYKLAADLLRQAAEEEGEIYVNHRAKSPAAESEDERVQRMRASIMLMDDLSAPRAEPATPPVLAIERKNA